MYLLVPHKLLGKYFHNERVVYNGTKGKIEMSSEVGHLIKRKVSGLYVV